MLIRRRSTEARTSFTSWCHCVVVDDGGGSGGGGAAAVAVVVALSLSDCLCVFSYCVSLTHLYARRTESSPSSTCRINNIQQPSSSIIITTQSPLRSLSLSFQRLSTDSYVSLVILNRSVLVYLRSILRHEISFPSFRNVSHKIQLEKYRVNVNYTHTNTYTETARESRARLVAMMCANASAHYLLLMVFRLVSFCAHCAPTSCCVHCTVCTHCVHTPRNIYIWREKEYTRWFAPTDKTIDWWPHHTILLLNTTRSNTLMTMAMAIVFSYRSLFRTSTL